MTFDTNDVLQRFHRVLVREIQASNPEYLNAPFSVAEIYQNLVPYRTHRDEIGVDMNADYEHALLRLLAGENDYLTIESRTARREIREELESPNPNTGLYRDFAAADVRLNSEVIDEALMWGPGKDEAASAEEPFNDELTTQEPGMGPAEESEEENMTPAAQDERPIEGFSEEEDRGAEEEGMEEEIVQESEGEEEASREGEGEVVADEGGEVDSEEVPFELSEQEVPWPPMVDLGGGRRSAPRLRNRRMSG